MPWLRLEMISAVVFAWERDRLCHIDRRDFLIPSTTSTCRKIGINSGSPRRSRRDDGPGYSFHGVLDHLMWSSEASGRASLRAPTTP